MSSSRILYCHCAYANIIPERVKNEVLDGLTGSGARFEAVADLCELSARRDPSLQRLAAGEGVLKIAACFPRSVKWLFSAAGAPLPDDVEVSNMRGESAADTVAALLGRSAPAPASESESGIGSGVTRGRDAKSGPAADGDAGSGSRPAASGAVSAREAGSA